MDSPGQGASLTRQAEYLCRRTPSRELQRNNIELEGTRRGADEKQEQAGGAVDEKEKK